MKLRVWNEAYGGYSQHDFNQETWSGFNEEYTDNNVRGLIAVTGTRKNGRSEWYDFETDLPVKVGDDVWFVYVIYSTGSTFGRADGNISFIDVFLTKEEARACEKAIYDFRQEGKNKDSWSVPYMNNGVEKDCHACWMGYFERLQDVGCDYLEIYPKGYDEKKGRRR